MRREVTPDWCMVTQFQGSFDSWWSAAAVVRCTWYNKCQQMTARARSSYLRNMSENERNAPQGPRM